jgi:hypothetical protein
VIANSDLGRLQEDGTYPDGRRKITENLKYRWLVSWPRFKPEHMVEMVTSTVRGETPVFIINREYKY